MKKLYVTPELTKFTLECDVIMASKYGNDYVNFWKWEDMN